LVSDGFFSVFFFFFFFHYINKFICKLYNRGLYKKNENKLSNYNLEKEIRLETRMRGK